MGLDRVLGHLCRSSCVCTRVKWHHTSGKMSSCQALCVSASALYKRCTAITSDALQADAGASADQVLHAVALVYMSSHTFYHRQVRPPEECIYATSPGALLQPWHEWRPSTYTYLNKVLLIAHLTGTAAALAHTQWCRNIAVHC